MLATPEPNEKRSLGDLARNWTSLARQRIAQDEATLRAYQKTVIEELAAQVAAGIEKQLGDLVFQSARQGRSVVTIHFFYGPSDECQEALFEKLTAICERHGLVLHWVTDKPSREHSNTHLFIASWEQT